MALGPADEFTGVTPPWLPCVVAAVSSGPPVGPAPAAADVALCRREEGGSPPGWVEVEDPEAELARLGQEIRHSPEASVLLAQVLRMGEALGAEDALLAESLAYSALQSGPVFTSWLGERRRATPKARDEADPAVLVERRGDRLVLTLNRPQVRNAVDVRLRDALAESLALACADPSISDVELRGAGPDFSSGGDLDTFGTLPDPVTAHLARTVRSPARLLARLGGRVTAHVHGACVGAGVELAAFAGTVVAAPGTSFRLPEVSMGLVPGSGGTVSLPRRIGRHRTAWLGLGGAALDVGDAARWGLVDDLAGRP